MSSKRILVVDPSESNRFYLKLVLEKNGYQVDFASNGLDAYQIFKNQLMDLVISELNLPFMNAYELIEKFKGLKKTNKQMIPVFIVTNEIDSVAIQKAVEAGADDFLQKPYSEQLFLAKVASLLRIKQRTSDLYLSNQKIASVHQNLKLEYRSAERIFEKFVHGPGKKVPGVEAHITPASVFNGDVFLSTVMPSGSILVLLGDFTGHGLPAAIGAIPVAEVFYSMVKRGRTPAEVLGVMNEKLKEILPVHIFFGCIMLKIRPSRQRVDIFNAGMQPVIQFNRARKSTLSYASTMPPLGILKNEEMAFDFISTEIDEEDAFFLYTDGLIEVANGKDQMFGVARLMDLIGSQENPTTDGLVQAAKNYGRDADFVDDVAVIKLSMNEIIAVPHSRLLKASNADIRPASHWALDFEFCHENIRHNDNPAEGMVDAIMMMQPIMFAKEDLYVVINELYDNAVEHGLLHLDSSIKDKQNGFIEYNQKKTEKLSELTEGKISIHVSQTPISEHAGEIEIKVSCASQPYVCQELKAEQLKEAQFSGRGLQLVNSLCERLDIDDVHSMVIAVYQWQQEEVYEA